MLKSTCTTKTKKNVLGSAGNLRVGRVIGNRQIFYFGLIKLCGINGIQKTQKFINGTFYVALSLHLNQSYQNPVSRDDHFLISKQRDWGSNLWPHAVQAEQYYNYNSVVPEKVFQMQQIYTPILSIKLNVLPRVVLDLCRLYSPWANAGRRYIHNALYLPF